MPTKKTTMSWSCDPVLRERMAALWGHLNRSEIINTAIHHLLDAESIEPLLDRYKRDRIEWDRLDRIAARDAARQASVSNV